MSRDLQLPARFFGETMKLLHAAALTLALSPLAHSQTMPKRPLQNRPTTRRTLAKPRPAPAPFANVSLTGRRTDWQKTPLVETFWGGLVTIENGTLLFTFLDGRVVPTSGIQGEFPNAIDMAVVGGNLMVLNGTTLYRFTPDSVVRERVGEDGAAPVMRHLAEYDGELWGIEYDGTLHRADANGVWTTVGAPGGWLNVTQFFSFKGQLFAADSGTLYSCDREAVWRQIGAVGEWRAINFMVPARNKIWMTGNSNMIAVDANGRKTLVGKGQWPRLDTLVALDNDLVSVRSDGTLAVTSTK